jgi:hypothetical protein
MICSSEMEEVGDESSEEEEKMGYCCCWIGESSIDWKTREALGEMMQMLSRLKNRESHQLVIILSRIKNRRGTTYEMNRTELPVLGC